ncbi:MAG: ATP-binding cassette domain-containing protein [Chloroflexi bacterium]|nr:ATP-binding cassette domain-containing protein [Chloroflexota bacterium]
MERLLEVQGIKKYFPIRKRGFLSRGTRWVKAVDGVDFAIGEGQTFSIVGESGCGKTTLSRLLLLLEKPTEGSVRFRGVDVNRLQGHDLKSYRTSVQAVFQDPYGSLNPRMRIGAIINEPLQACGLLTKREREERIESALKEVRLSGDAVDRYPHEFSGGQRQRIALARALATRPSVIVLDEPVSALDVSVRANVMNLLKDLQKELKLAYLLIAHDLATVRHMSDYMGVMYLGKMVERAPSEEFYSHPLHPYGQVLLAAAASRGGLECDIRILQGEVPSPLDPPAGCRFHPRCLKVMDICPREEPAFTEVGKGHWVACHLYK